MNEQTQEIQEDELPAVNTIEAPVSDVEIEVVDDRPIEDQKPARASNDDVDAEIANISGRTKKRIDKLKYDYHEERREKEQALRTRDESVKFAQQVAVENQKLKDTVARSEGALLNSLKTRTTSDIDAAKLEYKTAYESGDTDKLLDAQERLSAAYADKNYVENYTPTMPVSPQVNGIEQNNQQPVAQQNFAQQQQQVQIDPAAADYIRNNPWFESPGNEDMTALAYGMHAKLVREGVDPIRDSDIYYSRVDEAVKNRFPERFEGTNTASSQRPSTVVAPANRTGQKQRRVQLTKTQVDLARRLGLTPEQYASQYAKELQNG
jgi:hypothetical protein